MEFEPAEPGEPTNFYSLLYTAKLHLYISFFMNYVRNIKNLVMLVQVANLQGFRVLRPGSDPVTPVY